MSYQVLARKWRPQVFREMVGQEHVLTALINALEQGRLHHAYLFTGTRGVGKTSIARILAKCLNCEAGVSAEPCGQCSACREIVAGRFLDLIEVDAASRTKVEDTREMLENVQYAPSIGRYKIYLIDEVHMLSTHSFNALLKTLEEPPPHVKFLLATTDPQKLPATILSRCLQFSLKNMTPERIAGHLQVILQKEGVAYEEPALWLLGRSADGSMRDALSLTDQAISYGSGELKEVEVRAMLGTVDRQYVFAIMDALAKEDAADLLDAVAILAEYAPDFEGALSELNMMFHRLAIAQMVPDAIDNSQGDKVQILALAKQFAAEDVQLFYQMGLMGKRDMPLAPDPRSGFEMALLRMLAFKPQGVPDPPARQLSRGGAGVDETLSTQQGAGVAPDREDQACVKKSEAASETASGQTATKARAKTAVDEADLRERADNEQVVSEQTVNGQTVNEQFKAQTSNESKNTLISDGKVLAQNRSLTQPLQPSLSESVDDAQLPAESDSQAQVQTSDSSRGSVSDKKEHADVSLEQMTLSEMALSDMTRERWLDLFQHLDLGGVAKSIASHCVLTSCNGASFEFALDEQQSTIYNESHRQRFQQSVSRYFACDVALNITITSLSAETPAQCLARKKAERQQQANEAIHQDPNVTLLVEHFGGSIHPGSIVPVDK